LLAKNQYYAVKGSCSPQIYDSWPKCQAAVHGVKGALYKGFVTKEQAQEWLNIGLEGRTGSLENATSRQSAINPDELLIYVDGSFSPNAGEYAGWGYVVVQNDTAIFEDFGKSELPAKSRNIDGEVYAAMYAIEWCNIHNKSAVICHDYEGLGRWALGEWKAKSPIALEYVAKIQGKLRNIKFRKVSGHSGDKWNDVADLLAKKGIGLA
jgi:ribonuclease H-related protein